MSVIVAIFLVMLLFRIFTRRTRRVVPPGVQVIIVQQPAVPAARLTLEQELERIVEGSR
jgi:hypothetical protein